MVDVLLSYAHEDRAVSAAIAQELTKLGIQVWWDHDLLGGEDFRQRISEMLERTPATIVIWSRRSVHSKWVINEAALAEQHQRLIPVSIDGEPPPIDFRSAHTLDLKDWVPGDRLPDALVRAVAGRLRREIGYELPASPARGVSRLHKRVTATWYLDFENVVLYLIGQGLACFLVEATIPPLASRLGSSRAVWLPYALAVIEATIIAALYLRPVLEARRIAVAFRLFAISAALGVLAYTVLDAMQTLAQDELMIIFGSVGFAFVLITSIAVRNA
jgi:hypothetical protein